ncbi:hypothetical protein ACET3Z_011758 [Daucus carota]
MISTKPDRERNNSREKKSRRKIEDTEQPSIADKDYIVFKFNGKGGIDLVEEKSPPRNQDPAGKNRNQKGSKKAEFDECSESLQFKVGEDGGMISDNEVDESSVQSSKKLPLSEVKGGGDDTDVIIEVKESTPQKTLSESTRSDSSADPAGVHLILELCSGGELFDRIVARSKYTEVEAAAVVRQIAAGLAALHRANIIHRDLKPENCLFLNNSKGSPLKIMDFGLSSVEEFTDPVVAWSDYLYPSLGVSSFHCTIKSTEATNDNGSKSFLLELLSTVNSLKHELPLLCVGK